MKKENWALWLSIISLALSGYATLACDKRIEADWMGVLVGILSLLVTALIGLQIYNYISFKSELEKRVTEIVNERINKLNHAVTGYAKARLSNAIFMKAIPNSLNNAFDALEDIILSENIDPSNTALNCAIDKIVGAIDDIKSSNNGILMIFSNKKNHYLKLIRSIEHEDKDDIIVALKDAKEIE